MSEDNTIASAVAVTEDDLHKAGLPANMKMAPGLAIFFNEALYQRCKAVALRMSEATGIVGAHLINQPSACMAILSRAITWNLDPFSVAQCTYVVKGKIGYEGKLCQAILENSGAIDGQLKFEFFGDWDKLRGKFKMSGAVGSGERKPQQLWTDEDEIGLGVKVSAQVRGEATPRVEEFFLSEMQPRNSTLWVLRPKQQMRYATARAYGNLATPGIIMGIPFDVDPSGMGGDSMQDITPPKPTRSEFDRSPARDPAMGDWIAKLNFATALEEIGAILSAGLKELPAELHKAFAEAADNRAHQIEAAAQSHEQPDEEGNEPEVDPSIALLATLHMAKTIPQVANIRAEGIKTLPERDHAEWNANCDAKAKEITDAKPKKAEAPAKSEPAKAEAAKAKPAAAAKAGPETPLARGLRLLKRVDTAPDIKDLQESMAAELTGADLAEWKQSCKDREREIGA